MSESAARKAAYPDLYGTPRCPGAGLTRSTSRGRSYGSIGARHAGVNGALAGRAFFQSTESGSATEMAARIKNPKLAPPQRATFRHARAREGRDLQPVRDVRSAA